MRSEGGIRVQKETVIHFMGRFLPVSWVFKYLARN